MICPFKFNRKEYLFLRWNLKKPMTTSLVVLTFFSLVPQKVITMATIIQVSLFHNPFLPLLSSDLSSRFANTIIISNLLFDQSIKSNQIKTAFYLHYCGGWIRPSPKARRIDGPARIRYSNSSARRLETPTPRRDTRVLLIHHTPNKRERFSDLTASRRSMDSSAQRVKSPQRRCELGHGRALGQLYKERKGAT